MGFTLSDAEGHGDNSVGTGDSVETADEVGQVVQHAQVVLHHDDVPAETSVFIRQQTSRRRTVPLNEPVWGDERADGDGSFQPLLHIQITGWLVEHEAAVKHSKTH